MFPIANPDAYITTCPLCEEELPDRGLDVSFDPATGRHFVEWLPCCEGMRDAVGSLGWSEVFGRTLEADLDMFVGVMDVRRVDLSDSLCLWALEARAPGDVLPPAPGTDLARVKSPKGWRSEVFEIVEEHHSHHEAPVGHKFSVDCWNGSTRVGVAVVGRPGSRMLQAAEPRTLEVTRVCCYGDERQRRNASTKMYGAAAKKARELGADYLITYTRDDEDAASVRAANFVRDRESAGGGTWNRAARPRRRGRKGDGNEGPKVRWRLPLTKKARRELARGAAA